MKQVTVDADLNRIKLDVKTRAGRPRTKWPDNNIQEIAGVLCAEGLIPATWNDDLHRHELRQFIKELAVERFS